MISLSPPLQAVVALFRGPLAGVRFADIDATGLTHLAAEVEAAAAEVEAQQARLVELRQQLDQRQEALLGLAQQALAYARIYAENDEALTAELSDISLPRPAKPRKTPSRSSSPGSDQETLPSQGAAAASAPGGASETEAQDQPPESLGVKPLRRKVQRRLGRATSSESPS